MARREYNGFSAAHRTKAGAWFTAQGKPKPTTCKVCLQTKGWRGWHSEDYSEPFGPHIGEHGLCFVCHMMLHCRFRNPEAFEVYRTLIRAGARFAPIFGFPQLAADLLNRDPALWDDSFAVVNEPRDTTWLDTLSLTPIVHPKAPA